jgi:uncharacterized protein (TIGR02996 family)
MTQDDAFLDSIIENPDDNGLRLIYADWLEERGNPRAEFIRVQIELARLPDEDPRRAELEEREHQLFDEHGQDWLRPFRGILAAADCTPVFHGGFLSEITFWGQPGARRLLARAEALFRRAPICWLRLLPMGGHGVQSFPWDRPKLDVDRLRLADLQAITALPQLVRVTLLDLSGATLDNPSGGPELLVSNAIGDAGTRALADSPYLRGLKTLDLRDNIIGDVGALALVESPHLKQLTHLNLSGNRLSNGLMEELQRRCGDRVEL